MTGRPEMRISDAERDTAVSALGEHYAAGRLTKEEFDERSARAWSAKTGSELWPLFADLPAPHGVRPPAARGPAVPPQPQRQPRAQSWPGQWPERSPHRTGIPVGLILVVVFLLVVLTHVPWPLFLLLGCLWWFGPLRRRW